MVSKIRQTVSSLPHIHRPWNLLGRPIIQHPVSYHTFAIGKSRPMSHFCELTGLVHLT